MSSQRVALVTGATGFIGSHLCRHLCRKHWRVYAIVRRGSDTSPLPDAVTTHRICPDYSDLEALIEAIQPDVLFNMAAAMPGTAPEASHDTEYDVLKRANVELPEAIGKALGHARTDSTNMIIVHAASWSEWDETGQPYTAISAPTVYAQTKIAGRKSLNSAAMLHEFKMLSLVVHDTYGPGDWRGKLLDRLVSAAMSGESIAMTPGAQMIDLVHVDDVVRAFERGVALLRENRGFEDLVYAVASGKQRTIKTIAGMVADAAQTRLKIKWGALPYRQETAMKVGKMAKRLPGWRPSISFEDGLAELVRKAYLSNARSS